MNTSQLYLQTWNEARTRFTNLLKEVKEEDLIKGISKNPTKLAENFAS